MSKFKKYLEIIQELKVNPDTDFESQKEMLRQRYLKSGDLNKEAGKEIKSDDSVENIKKLFQSEHVQNNHFTWNNSGSKYLIEPNKIVEEIKNSKLRPKGKITTLGPTGKEFTSRLMRVMTKNQVGTDYSMSTNEENEAIDFYNKNKEIIDNAFNKVKQGLKYALPIYENGKIIYYLEKRHGNPYTKFFLKVGKGKPTNIINLIPDGKGGWFTSYPGIPPKTIDFSKPACLLIDASERVENKAQLKIEFEKAIRITNIKNFIELISGISKDKKDFPAMGTKLGFEHHSSAIKKQFPNYTKNINYLINQYPEIKKDLQSVGYSGDKLINQFMSDYKKNNQSEKEKIKWFYENYINNNPKVKMIFNS